MSLTPYRIEPERLPEVWPEVGPQLARALRYNACIDMDDVLSFLEAGSMQLLVVIDEETGEIVASLATEITDYPKLRCLRIVLAGGERLTEWRDEMHDLIEAGAQAADCEVIEIVGRDGWVRRLADKDYHAVHVTIQRKVGGANGRR